MSEEDNDLVKMVTGALAIPEKFQTPLFMKIASYRPISISSTADKLKA